MGNQRSTNEEKVTSNSVIVNNKRNLERVEKKIVTLIWLVSSLLVLTIIGWIGVITVALIGCIYDNWEFLSKGCF